MTQRAPRRNLIPRNPTELNFGDDIPVNWADGDVFRSRFFDAFSTTLPEGEKFFIVSLRHFKEQIKDPVIQKELKNFIRQEGVHGILHNAYNDRLSRQGVNIEAITRFLQKFFALHTKLMSKEMQLTMTACAEHLTASMAHSILGESRELFDRADDQVRALYYWHAAEEIEHKSVAFDLLKSQTEVSYLQRVLMMAYMSVFFHALVFPILEHVLRTDGYSLRERVGYWGKGLWWMFKPAKGGFYRGLLAHYLQWFRPGFQPWDHGDLEAYDEWCDAYNEHQDVRPAAEKTHALLAEAA